MVCRNDDTRSQAIAGQFGAIVAVVNQAGLAAAVETGISAVQADIAAFVDDDARPLADWSHRIVQHFANNDMLAFLGGRDNVHGDREAGSPSLQVGKLRRGKLVGNHHLGKGDARPATLVKGANMALKVSVVRGLPIGRLVTGSGAQRGNELAEVQG